MRKYPYQGKGSKGLIDLFPSYKLSDLKIFFKNMLRIRLIEEAIANHYQDDLMKTPIHLCIGQEAISVGSCFCLRKKDKVFCGHRTHGPYLAKGGDLKAMLSELHCRKNGCCASRGGSMHLIDRSVGMEGSSAIVAGITPIATGAALAAKQKNDDLVVVTYSGDAAFEEGVTWESINFAKLKNLPILYICENNFYSVCSPMAYRQHPSATITQKVKGFGLYSQIVDGTNVLAMDQATKQALHYIQKGNGPAFIEAHTYRWLGHHGAKEDTYLGYRTKEELISWQKVDPILLLESLLTFEQNEKKNIISQIKAEIDEGFAYALNSPFPTADDLFTHVYAGEFDDSLG